MVGIGVAVGACVSGLLLFMFTNENARYYAVFKALGAGNRIVVAMVVAQALVAGLAGFCLGVGASSLMGLIVKSPAMPYTLTPSTLLFTGVTVLVVMVFAAALSSLKVVGLEPGRVFSS